MRHRKKSRVRWISRLMRWLDKRRTWRETRPRITPYEASLFAANEGYKLRRERVYAK